jgi:tricarballylate dehydrogenase
MTGVDASQIVDVLVIGGGSAGLSAALAARHFGASVRLIEQAPLALRGGNARHARNFRLMHDRPTRYVAGAYSEMAFLQDLLRVTRGASDEQLARRLIQGSATIAEWLAENGVRLQDAAPGAMPRSCRTAFLLGGGKAMINALYATAARIGVAIEYESDLVGLDFDDGRNCHATMVHSGKIQRIVAKTAVICAGGHQANLDWLRQDIGAAADGFVVRGTPYATGSVLRLLLKSGVKPVGHASRCHLVVVDARGPKYDGGIVTRITGIPYGIVVDRNATRFADEREDVGKTHFARWGARIAECPGQIAHLILDAGGVARAPPTAWPPIQAASIAALAETLGLDQIVLDRTVRTFNHAVADRSAAPSPAQIIDGPAPPTSYAVPPLVLPPFAAYPMRPGITFTHFGVAVDNSLRIRMDDSRPASRVFAAGMIMAANILSQGYLAGLGITIATVFGRLAGEAAAREARQ